MSRALALTYFNGTEGFDTVLRILATCVPGSAWLGPPASQRKPMPPSLYWRTSYAARTRVSPGARLGNHRRHRSDNRRSPRIGQRPIMNRGGGGWRLRRLRPPLTNGLGRVSAPGTGTGDYRVPDFDPALTIPARGTVVEVKNRQDLGHLPPTARPYQFRANPRRAAGDLHECSNAHAKQRARSTDSTEDRHIEPHPMRAARSAGFHLDITVQIGGFLLAVGRLDRIQEDSAGSRARVVRPDARLPRAPGGETGECFYAGGPGGGRGAGRSDGARPPVPPIAEVHGAPPPRTLGFEEVRGADESPLRSSWGWMSISSGRAGPSGWWGNWLSST